MIDEGCRSRHGLGLNMPGIDSDTLIYSITTLIQYHHKRKYYFNENNHEIITFINIHKTTQIV